MIKNVKSDKILGFSRLLTAICNREVTTLINGNLRGRRLVGWWFMGCAGMVFGAVSIGGLTRYVHFVGGA